MKECIVALKFPWNLFYEPTDLRMDSTPMGGGRSLGGILLGAAVTAVAAGVGRSQGRSSSGQRLAQQHSLVGMAPLAKPQGTKLGDYDTNVWNTRRQWPSEAHNQQWK